MRVDELLATKNKKPLFSVELWPPRTPASETKLTEALEILSKLHMDFVSITYGAGGSTRENTHELVMRLMKDYGIPPVAHLVTGAHKKLEIEIILERYRSSGVENLLALHGDPPLGATQDLQPGELAHAIELVRIAKFDYGLCVGVAVHPGGHPNSKSKQEDLCYQAEKLLLADYAITQFFYKPSEYHDLVQEMANRGVNKPIIPGIMAPTSFSTLNKMADLSGTVIPSDVYQRLARYASDPVGFQNEGTLVAIELAEQLLNNGAPGIHVFSKNQAATTVAIYEALGIF